MIPYMLMNNTRARTFEFEALSMSNFSRHTETFFGTLARWDNRPLPLGFGRLDSTMNIPNYTAYNSFLMEISLYFYSFL